MIDYIAGIILLISAIVVFIASIGIWRFSNLFARMHAVTKVSSMGILLLLIGINLLFRDWIILLKSMIIFGVLVFLSPVGSHVIAKVARNIKTPGTTDEAE